ncbi:hypothetical protein V6N13_001332 [Hibiscus sabdariffa]
MGNAPDSSRWVLQCGKDGGVGRMEELVKCCGDSVVVVMEARGCRRRDCGKFVEHGASRFGELLDSRCGLRLCLILGLQ